MIVGVEIEPGNKSKERRHQRQAQERESHTQPCTPAPQLPHARQSTTVEQRQPGTITRSRAT